MYLRVSVRAHGCTLMALLTSTRWDLVHQRVGYRTDPGRPSGYQEVIAAPFRWGGLPTKRCLAFPDRLAEIDGARARQGTCRGADARTDRRTGEGRANQGATNRTDRRTDTRAAQATIARGVAATRQGKHADYHRQVNSNAFHDLVSICRECASVRVHEPMFVQG
jgi:hypothetical protein